MAIYFDRPKKINPQALKAEGYTIVPIKNGQKTHQVLDTIFRDSWCSCGKPHALVYGVHMLAELDGTDTEHCEKTKECVRLALNKVKETEERAAALLANRPKMPEAESSTSSTQTAPAWENTSVGSRGRMSASSSKRPYGGPVSNQRGGKAPFRRVV